MSKGPRLPKLPKGFIWGASTAAAQIEGAAGEDGRTPSIWDEFAATPGKIKDGATPAVACDHYHRYKEDVALMKRLGLGAYRFSVSWSRVLPEGAGALNEKGLDFYSRLIDELLASDIEPWLCLYHWDLPLALHRRGGWPNRDCAQWFADYAELLAGRFGDRVARWATFNEPGVFTIAGYAVGFHAPGISDFGAYLAAAHNVNRAHGAAVSALRAAGVKGEIGVVCNQQPARPATPSEEDKAAAGLYDLFWNRAFADPMILGAYPEGLTPFFGALVKEGDLASIKQPLDFFGLNHYSPSYVKSDPSAPGGIALAKPPEGAPVTMMGWEIAPKAFAQTLIHEHARYRLPIVVTENGFADREDVGVDGRVDDRARIDYLAKYIGAVKAAIDAGARVDGYFVWSLIDNFEWAEGFEPRFGLVHIDYKTQKRTPKRSFEWMREEVAKQERRRGS
ncbi:MAG: GH1 family beta-glucosidase [Pseudomonadota bacterium]